MRRVIFAIISTAAGLAALLSFKTHSLTGAVPPAAAISTPNTTSSAPSASPSASGGSGSGRSPGDTGTGSASASKTVTGDAADTMYGPVQVEITVKDGKITDAQAVEYPQESMRDEQINSYAIPDLNQEAVGASSANIDAVSGATYTSEGYLSSLQSALDKAGL